MYALRRTIAAFVLGALLCAPAAVTGAAPVPTLAQVLASGNRGNPDVVIAGADTVDGYGGNISLTGGYATGQGVPGMIDLVGGFGQNGGSPAEVTITGPDGAAGGNLDLYSGNGYQGPAGNISLRPGTSGTSAGLVIITYLPTADPHVAGALYDTGDGIVRRSAG